jgi:GTP-binding protein
LFEGIIKHIPGPEYDPAKPFQMLVADLDYSDYIGRLAIGKIVNGTAKCNDNLVRINEEGSTVPLRISKLQVYDGLSLKEVESLNPEI